MQRLQEARQTDASGKEVVNCKFRGLLFRYTAQSSIRTNECGSSHDGVVYTTGTFRYLNFPLRKVFSLVVLRHCEGEVQL